MKTAFVLIFMSLLVSCEPSNQKNSTSLGKTKDSVLFYYGIAKDEGLSLNRRRQAINKSLFHANKATGKDTLYFEILYQKNRIHFSLKEYDSLQIFNKLLVNTAKGDKAKFTLGKQYYLMGYYFGEVVHIPDSAFNNYNRSKNYFEQLMDSSRIGRNLLNMGTIQKDQNDFFGSKETITEALRFLNLENDRQYIAYCYSTLGANHRKLLNYQDAITYYLKSIEATDSETDRLIYKNNLAASYIDTKQYNRAKNLLNSILSDTLSVKNPQEHGRVLDNIAYVQWLSEGNKKVESFRNPLQLRKEHNDKRGQIASYTHLGEFYSNTNPQMAESYFDSVIQLSRTLKIPRAEKDALKFLMQLKPRNIEFRDRYVFLQDSLYAQELKVKTQFAKYKYDDKLKQESILRLEKEKAEKALEASQQRNQKIVYLGGSLFLASILGLSLYSFRQRTKRLKQENKTARLEASFETEGALSRKLHDDYGGKLNYTISLVQNGADASVILDNLESLNDQNRDFSRVINEIDTGQYYKDELMGMLGSRKPLNTKLFTSGLEEFDWSALPALTKTTLFKVLQELMINMTRHSKAETVALTLETGSNGLQINYEDDGVGASKKELQVKNGLRNTEKRIQAIGGTITFDSDKGNGFRAEIHIPT